MASPVSAHPGLAVSAAITETPLAIEELLQLVRGPGAGAVWAFEGNVRDNDAGRTVRSLRYEAHPGAAAVLDEIVTAAAGAAAPDVLAIAVRHRVGDLVVGDTAFAVAVSARHRAPAAEVCMTLVEAVKQQLPIWKRQLFLDGTHEWVNSL